MKPFIYSVVFGCLCSLPAAAQTEDRFIFDLLAHGNYRAAYRKLTAKPKVPDWVKDVLRTRAGTAAEGKTLTIGGKPYRLDRICRTSDCKAASITVLFAPGGSRAWASLTDGGAPPVMLGDPNPEIAQALTGSSAQH